MKDFSKAMAVIGMSLGLAMLPISIISLGLYFNQLNKPVISDNDRIPFSRGDKSRIEDNICIVGMMEAPSANRHLSSMTDNIFLVPPTSNLNSASVSAYCMWERTNGHLGRPFSRFFPVFSNGVVDTSIVIGACYNREDVPNGSEILFSDEKFKFYKNSGRQETEEKGIYFFIENAGDNYPMPMQNQTAVYQLYKKSQNAGDALFVEHNRSSRYDIRKLYNNIDSSDDIDYDYYSPLS